MPDQMPIQPEVGAGTQPEAVPTLNQPEAAPIAEQVQASPVQPSIVIPAKAGIQQVPDPGSFVPTQDDADIASEEVEDLTSSTVEPADNDWVGKVRDVIREDKDQPFKEEEDAEDLNQAYMKDRFNVKIDEEGK